MRWNGTHPTDGLSSRSRPSKRLRRGLTPITRTSPDCGSSSPRGGRGIASISLPEALEVAMCFGWVDSKMHRHDHDYYVPRYQPRRPKSTWSARNKDLAERLIADGRMRPSDLAHVKAAKADGRQDAS